MEEVDYDILDLQAKNTPHKKLKYLGHLADTTPFGLVEINMHTLTKSGNHFNFEG